MAEHIRPLRLGGSGWRARLAEATAKTPEHTIPPAAIDALEREGLRLVRYHTGEIPPRRPSAIRRDLERVAGQLRRAADTLERLGPRGLLLILAQDAANRGLDDLDPRVHIAYLRRLADLAHRAPATAADEAVSQLDHRGGQPRPVQLDVLVATLRGLFEHQLGLRASSRPHDRDLDQPTLFEQFVLELVQGHAQVAGEPDAASIRAAIHAAVQRPARDLLEPPGRV